MAALTKLLSTSTQNARRFQRATIYIMSTALYMLCNPLFEGYFFVKAITKLLLSTKTLAKSILPGFSF